MAESTFEIVFSGKLADGAERDTVISNLASLFKTSNEKIERLFSGGEFILKSNLDEATAQRYQVTLQKAGAVCEMRHRQPMTPQADAADESTPAPPQEGAQSSTDTQAASGATPMETDSAAETGGDMTIDPPGVTIIEPTDKVAVEIDTSAFTLAPAGSDVLEEEKPPPPPPPDTGELSLAPTGSDILEKEEADK